MKTQRISILVILVSLLFISFVFAQDNTQENTAQPASKEIVVTQKPMVVIPSSNEPETQWVWGEVVSTVPASKSLTIKYLDYETDQEKDMVVNIDEKTTYENIKTIDEIKPKDTLSIDYIVGTDNKIIAKNISLEKPESVPAPQEAPSEEVSPESMQPAVPVPAAGQ